MFYVSLSQKNKKSENVSSQVDSSILKSLTLHLRRLYMNLTLVKFNLNLVKLNLNLTLKLDFILYNLYLFSRRLLGGSVVSDNNNIFRSKLKYFQLLENL